jgi:hypothetical protein
MTPAQARQALDQLFKGHKRHLTQAIRDTADGERASIVAHRHIEPIIEAINLNAGQEMDPTYVAYLIQFAHFSSPDLEHDDD